MSETGTLTYEEFSVGETCERSIRTVTQADIRLFIGATGSTHPSHVNRSYCDDHPIFDNVVAQGVLTLGIADGFVAEEILARAAIGLNYGHESVEYRSPVYPGDTLHGRLEIVDSNQRDEDWGLLTITVDLTNQKDRSVLHESHRVLIGTTSLTNKMLD